MKAILALLCTFHSAAHGLAAIQWLRAGRAGLIVPEQPETAVHMSVEVTQWPLSLSTRRSIVLAGVAAGLTRPGPLSASH